MRTTTLVLGALALSALLGATAASASPSPEFAAESYPAILGGANSGNHILLGSFTKGIECEASKLSNAVLEEASETVTATPSYSGCVSYFAPHGEATFNAHGCKYRFHASGTVDVAECSGAGMTFEVPRYGAPNCTYTIPPQTGLDTEYEAVGSGSSIEFALHTSSMEFSYSGGGTCGEGTVANSTTVGAWSVAGENEEEEAVGIYLTRHPVVEAEGYSVTLAGSAPETLETSVGKLICPEETLSGQLVAPGSSLALDSEPGKCHATALEFPTTVAMNSCRYTVEVLDLGPPYSGSLGVACEDAEDAIEYVVYDLKTGETPVCTIKVGPQSGLEGLGLSNTGAGAERGIAIDAEASGVEYEYSGSLCGEGAAANGVVSGEGSLSGVDEDEMPVGIWLAGIAA